MDFIFGILGFVGGLICALGDIFLDLKGSDNAKLGTHKMVESGWQKMAAWRFSLSVNLASIGAPLYVLGLIAMSNQLRAVDPTFGMVFFIIVITGACGTLFIHASICYSPVIYKLLFAKQVSVEIIDEVLKGIWDAAKIPFLFMYTCLVAVTSVMISIAILKGWLGLSPVFILLTPLILMLVGLALRFANRRLFCDLPGIVMPSIGLGCIGLMAALNTLAS
jgi:hypothetical protein